MALFLCACRSIPIERSKIIYAPPTNSITPSSTSEYSEPYLQPEHAVTFAYPIPDMPDVASTTWEIQHATNIAKFSTEIAAYTATPTEIPLKGLHDCLPDQLKFEVGENGASGEIFLGISIYHRKGPACRLSTQISLTLLDICGNLLPIEGNNQVIYLEGSLQPGSLYNARGITYIWRNWCGSRNNYSWRLRAAGAGQEINDYTLFSPPACQSSNYPSRLYLERRNYSDFGIPTIIPIGTATQLPLTSPTCVVTATPLATAHLTRTALPTSSALKTYP
jgi:hypothetical protein